MAPEDAKEDVQSDLAGFEGQWNDTDPAEDKAPGKTVPPSTYKCGVQDHDWVKSNNGNRGLKILFEILEPETVEDEGRVIETRGEIISHVFWITKKNLPYVKRDVRKLLGRDLKSIQELAEINWMECFAEIVSRNEKDPNGWVNSRAAFINEWHPNQDEKKKAEASASTKGGEEDEVAF